MRIKNKVVFCESINVLFKKSNKLQCMDVVHVLEISFFAFKSSLPLRVQSFFFEERSIIILGVSLCLNHAECKMKMSSFWNKTLEFVG